MPTDDRATSKPTNTSSARVALLTALRRDSSPPVAERNKRDSMAADIQSVISITTPAVTAPSSKVRTDSMEPPTFHLMSSSSSRITGSRPLTQSTTAIQASHEMVRSSALISGASLNATCKTLTPRRISASDSNTGMASLKIASGNRRINRALEA